jgi:glutaredoxin 3
MTAQRTVEIFSAGCPACQEAIEVVKRISCPSCDVRVLDMNDIEVVKRAKQLGVRAVPAVAIDGQLAECCSESGIDEQVLKIAGIGKRL